MHFLNEYYKSHTYESVTLKEIALNKKIAYKKRVFQTHLRADFLVRIVRAIRGFTVYACKRSFAEVREDAFGSLVALRSQ